MIQNYLKQQLNVEKTKNLRIQAMNKKKMEKTNSSKKVTMVDDNNNNEKEANKIWAMMQ